MSILYLLGAPSHINYGQQIPHIPFESLIKYTYMIHEDISYELNFDVPWC